MSDNERVTLSIAPEVFEVIKEDKSEFETWNSYLMDKAGAEAVEVGR